jgi:hypothetical protein
MCQNEEHVKYAVLATELYQEKAVDFSEELNGLFVKACIRGNNPHAAAKHFIHKKNRMGAWCTSASLNRLLEELDPKADAELIVQLVNVLSSKGVRIDKTTALLSLHALANSNASTETFDNVLTASMKWVSPEDYAHLKEAFEKARSNISNTESNAESPSA